MSRLGRGLTALSGSVVITLLGVNGPAFAGRGGGSFQACLNQAVDHNGEPPTCTKVGDTWVASWPHDSSTSGAVGVFVFLALVGLAIGVGITVWKVSTAQKLAKRSGMDRVSRRR
jgi:hypothetical protein